MLTLIYFSTEWCEPCKIQDSIVSELKRRFNTRVNFISIDADTADGRTVSKYKVSAVPLIIIEKDSIIVSRFVGITRQETIEKIIKENI